MNHAPRVTLSDVRISRLRVLPAAKSQADQRIQCKTDLNSASGHRGESGFEGVKYDHKYTRTISISRSFVSRPCAGKHRIYKSSATVSGQDHTSPVSRTVHGMAPL